jgi:signal transduction histidine kinase
LGETIWAINPKHDNFESLLSYMRSHISDFFEGSNFEVDIDFPDEIPEMVINPGLIRNIYLVLKESLNNAVKYSGAGHISIVFNCTKTHYHLSISDDGRGFEKDNIKENSNGLRNMRKRIESTRGIFNITSNRNEGTTVSIEGEIF